MTRALVVLSAFAVAATCAASTLAASAPIRITEAGGASFPGDPSFPFNDVAGVLTFTPVGSSNNGITLRVPYYMVPQAVSNVDTRVETTRATKTHPSATTAVSTNYRGAAAGSAWWFDWGIKDKRDHGLHSNDIQAVGATVYPGQGQHGSDLLYFAISTNHRWSNAAQNVFDVFVDVNGDGTPDFQVQAADEGALQGLPFNGIMDVAVALATGGGFIDYQAVAATDSNTIMLPVDSERLCSAFYGVSGPCYGDSPRFTYTADAASWTDGTVDTTDMTGSFNPTASAVNNGMFDPIDPNGSVSEALTVNPAEQAIAPALGWLVISQENKSREESELIPVGDASHH